MNSQIRGVFYGHHLFRYPESELQNRASRLRRDEVDVFLERVASEIDDLNDEIARLRVQVKEAASASRTEVISERPVAASDEEAKPAGIDPALVAEKDAMIAELEAKLRDRKSDDTAIAQALIVAQRTADEIVSKAKADAGQTRQNAEDEGRRILEKANAEKQKVIDHINELSSSREKGSRAVPGYAEGIHRLRNSAPC